MMHRIFSVLFVLMLITGAPAFAMTFTGAEHVMQIGVDMGTRELKGETSATVTDLDGTELVFALHDTGSFKTNFASFESADGAHVYLTFPAGMRLSVKEITTDEPRRRFWLARTGIGVSVDTCSSFCLLGRYGDTYVNYVSLDDLWAAGLVGHEVLWKVEDGELVVEGWKRNWGEDLERTGEMHSLVGEVRLFWDDDAQWMGIRRTLGSPAASEEDTWFYTDADGADYYLRRTDMGRAWIGGIVVKADADGDAVALVYRFENYPDCPYSIRYGDTFVLRPGLGVEHGLLYGDDPVDPSAVALYEGHLYQKMARAIANRRAAEERHRGS